jgi:hypothetical protein
VCYGILDIIMNPDPRFTNQDPLISPVSNQPLPGEPAPKIVRTFEDDVADAVRDSHGSVLGIALAEQKRREATVEVFKEKKSNVLFIVLGVVLLIISFVVLAFLAYQRFGGAVFPDIMKGTASFAHPHIRSDKTIPVPLDTLLPKNGVSRSMLYSLGGSGLSTGAVTLAIPTEANTEGVLRMSETDTILKRLAPNAPKLLSRSLATSTVLGIYSGDVAEPFIVLKTVSYEGAFSGMLEWEEYMSDDLYTFFAVILPTEEPVVTTTSQEPPISTTPLPTEVFGTSTATSTATSTTSTSTMPIQTPKPVIVAPTTPNEPLRDITKFVDRTIKNKDMRVIEDLNGKIYFLYGFANQSTIVITTSVESFFEISDRLR